MKRASTIWTGTFSIVLCVIVLGINSAIAKPIKELVLYYPLADSKSWQVKDLSSQHNNGQAAGIIVSNSPSLVSMEQTRQLTIALWIKPHTIPSEFPVILAKGGDQPPGDYGGYELSLNANGDNDIVFRSGSCIIDTHGAYGRWVNNHLDEWIHIVFTIDDTTKIAKFYVNGSPTNDEYDYGSYFNANTPLNFNLPNNLYIGKPDPAANADRACFDGTMRQVMIFNRALSATEVHSLFNDTKPVNSSI